MRRLVLTCGLLLAAGCPQSVLAAEARYPERPVRVVVPFPPGGGTDIVARMVMLKLAERMAATFVIDNRGGAGGTIGTDVVAKAPPDGYTIGLVSGSHAINPSLYRKLPYDTLRDFAPVTLLVSGPGVLVTAPTLGVRSVKDLIAVAKTKPGHITYASAGSGTPPHLSGELFRTMAGITIVHVPYKGNAQAMTDLAGGQVAMSFPTLPSALPLLRVGKLVALGVTGSRRIAALPDVPTIAEAALPGYESVSWYGIVAPANTPEALRTRLQRELRQVVYAPDMKDRLSEQGLEPVAETPAQFGLYISSEIAKWGKVVAASGARVE